MIVPLILQPGIFFWVFVPLNHFYSQHAGSAWATTWPQSSPFTPQNQRLCPTRPQAEQMSASAKILSCNGVCRKRYSSELFRGCSLKFSRADPQPRQWKCRPQDALASEHGTSALSSATLTRSSWRRRSSVVGKVFLRLFRGWNVSGHYSSELSGCQERTPFAGKISPD